METKDLRIGNYVSYLGEPQEVLGMDKTQVYIKPFNFVLFLDIDEVEPIPITKEWLLNFRFEKKIGGDDMVYFNNNEVNIYLCNDLNKFWFELENGLEIKYVHQLQNLYFALTNEELKLI